MVFPQHIEKLTARQGLICLVAAPSEQLTTSAGAANQYDGISTKTFTTSCECPIAFIMPGVDHALSPKTRKFRGLFNLASACIFEPTDCCP